MKDNNNAILIIVVGIIGTIILICICCVCAYFVALGGALGSLEPQAEDNNDIDFDTIFDNWSLDSYLTPTPTPLVQNNSQEEEYKKYQYNDYDELLEYSIIGSSFDSISVSPAVIYKHNVKAGDKITDSITVKAEGDIVVSVREFWFEFDEECYSQNIDTDYKTDYSIGNYVDLISHRVNVDGSSNVNLEVNLPVNLNNGNYWFAIEIKNGDEMHLVPYLVEIGEPMSPCFEKVADRY